jgi:hypothetical protein
MTVYYHRGFTITVESFAKKLIYYTVSRDVDGWAVAGGEDSGAINDMINYWKEEIDELINTNGASRDVEEYFMEQK